MERTAKIKKKAPDYRENPNRKVSQVTEETTDRESR